MKMEHVVEAASAGPHRLGRRVAVGDAVQTGDVLALA